MKTYLRNVGRWVLVGLCSCSTNTITNSPSVVATAQLRNDDPARREDGRAIPPASQTVPVPVTPPVQSRPTSAGTTRQPPVPNIAPPPTNRDSSAENTKIPNPVNRYQIVLKNFTVSQNTKLLQGLGSVQLDHSDSAKNVYIIGTTAGLSHVSESLRRNAIEAGMNIDRDMIFEGDGNTLTVESLR